MTNGHKKLILTHGAGSRQGQTQEFSLAPGESITLGRQADCDVSYDPHIDIAASGRHARIGVSPDGSWFIEDLGSSTARSSMVA